MTGNGSDPEPASEDSRLVSLEERLDRAEAAEAKRTAGTASPESDANYRLGNRVLAAEVDLQTARRALADSTGWSDAQLDDIAPPETAPATVANDLDTWLARARTQNPQLRQLTLAVANVVGSLLGTHMALKHGTGFVRGIFILVVSTLILKTGYDAFLR